MGEFNFLVFGFVDIVGFVGHLCLHFPFNVF
jgi:hypothetical protein